MFFKRNPDGIVDCEKVLYFCHTCNGLLELVDGGDKLIESKELECPKCSGIMMKDGQVTLWD